VAQGFALAEARTHESRLSVCFSDAAPLDWSYQAVRPAEVRDGNSVCGDDDRPFLLFTGNDDR